MNERKFTENTIKKNWSLTTILSDGVPVHNRFCAPSEDVYCKREVVEMILVETPGGMKGEYLFKVAPSGKHLPGGSKVKEIFDKVLYKKIPQKIK